MRKYKPKSSRYTQKRLRLSSPPSKEHPSAKLKDATMTTVLLDGETRKLAKAVSRATGVSVGELIRRGLRKLLSGDDK